MTGSPVLKFKPNSSKKPKLLRKISLQETNEFPSALPLQSRTAEYDPYSFDGVKNERSFNSRSQNASNQHEPNKSVCSSLSSFVFPSKKCVKRKLNFDLDGGNDDSSSLRFSDKNLSSYGFRSKKSSIADQTSLPDIRDAVQSPNKNRSRLSSSYRSSVGSVISCRRRLFSEYEPPLKNFKPTSPVLCQKSKLHKKEIKLSLKKKFPGVPNSDSARSGLLLNLAFSKYNLSNSKKDDVSVNFVDNVAVSAGTKKDFVNYSQIKKNESSLCRSPVFMAIKKVKRKLNLEDQSTAITDCSLIKTTDNLNANSSSKEISTKLNELEHDTINENEKPEKSPAEDNNLKNKEEHDNSEVPYIANEINENCVKTIVPFSPLISNQNNLNVEFSPSKKVSNTKYQNNLFKNSKIRSTLRDKIFDLSKEKESSEQDRTNNLETEKASLRKQNNFGDESKNMRDFDAFLRKHDTNRDFKKSCSLKIGDQSLERKGNSRISRQRKNLKKWINNDSFMSSNSKKHDLKSINATSSNQKFIKSHIDRFLNDCMIFVSQNEKCENDELLSDNLKDSCNETKIQENEIITNEKNCNDEPKSYLIENVDSQEQIIIENVDSQHEEIVIEPVASQIEPKISENVNDIDVDALLSASQDCKIVIALKDCVSKKSPKMFEDVDTDLIAPLTLDKVAIPKLKNVDFCTSVIQNDADASFSGRKTKIDEICSGASYSCVQFTNTHQTKATPEREDLADQSNLLDTTKKTKKKKCISNTLASRLDKLLNREISDFRIWEYEMSKVDFSSNFEQNPAIFCIKKMWKEYSYLILLCSYYQKDAPEGKLFESSKIESLITEIQNTVIILLEPEYCPKNLSYSSVFQVHPPWKLLNFEECDPLLMLKPRKISIISKDENPVLYKDPTIPETFVVSKQQEFCSCENYTCNCHLPDSYQFLIEPLLLPHLQSLSSKTCSFLRFNENTFNSKLIKDVLIKHKLFADRDCTLNVKILHSQKNESVSEFSFWSFICVDEAKNLCCVFAENGTDNILPFVKKEVIVEFTGITPWKLISPKNASLFLEYMKFTNVPDDLEETIYSRSIIIFLFSNQYRNVRCVV